jgi:hypothetical protein
MNIYTYDFELQTMTTMLMNCFSDIIIKRFNVNRDARDQIKTRVVYAPKQRVLNDLLDKDQNIQLPVISVQIGGIARDESRVFNKLMGTFHHPANTTYSLNEKGPQPIDVTYNLSIMTRYQQDMDQILSHLLPYINPYFVVSWRTPQRPDFEIRSNVVWSGQTNIQYPVELNANQVARVVADLSFTFKGWLFQNQTKHENIFTFDSTFNAVASRLEFLDAIELDIHTKDNIVQVEAPPQPRVLIPDHTKINTRQQFSVWGRGFHGITNVYLSGAPVANISSTQNPFVLNSSLSSSNPAFNGYKLETNNWNIDIEENLLTFVVPSISSIGTMDLILENQGGYSLLTKCVRINNFNPFKQGSDEFNEFVPYQLPYLSGIAVHP